MYHSAKNTDTSAIAAIAHYRQLLLRSAVIGMATAFLVSCGDEQQQPTFKTAQSEQVETATGYTSGRLAGVEQEALTTMPSATEPEDATTVPAAIEVAPLPSEPTPVSQADPAAESAPLTAMPDAADLTTTFTNPSGPPWALNVMSLASKENAQAVVRTLTALGFTPLISEVMINGKHLYRVRIKGFATRDEATKAGQTIVARTQYETPWTSGY